LYFKLSSAASPGLVIVAAGAGGRIWLVAHYSTPQNTIESGGINRIGMFEVESLGCCCPPGTIVQ
jgi:hypothetical protein